MKVKLLLLLISSVATIPVFANSTLDQAFSQFQDENYQYSLILYSNAKGYSARMGEGSSAYRLGDFKHAINQYTIALLRAKNDSEKYKSLFNLANSYYKNNEFIKSIETYKYLLLYNPESEEAQGNLWSAQSMLIEKIKNNKLYMNKESVNYNNEQDVNQENLLDEDEKISKTEKIGYLRTLIGDRVAEGELNAIANNDKSLDILMAKAMQIKNYLSAIKKLDFVEDNPKEILKSIIDFEGKENQQ